MNPLTMGFVQQSQPNRLGRLWHGLANVALHVEIPTSKDVAVTQYGKTKDIARKVEQTPAKIREISEGTLLMSSGMGEVVSFPCSCGSTNKRRLELLKDGQTINCINPDCDESYRYVQSDTSFERRTFEIVCSACGESHDIPNRKMEKLRTDKRIKFDCVGTCGETIYVSWRPMQAQRTEPPHKD